MSKVDAQRALRDARFARFAAARAATAAAPKKEAKNEPTAEAPTRPPVAEELFESPVAAEVVPVAGETTDAKPEPAVDEELCGHASMNGRKCTRVKGHSEKNHRYS